MQTEMYIATSFATQSLVCILVTIYMYYMQNPTSYSFLGSWQWSTRGQQMVLCSSYSRAATLTWKMEEYI